MTMLRTLGVKNSGHERGLLDILIDMHVLPGTFGNCYIIDVANSEARSGSCYWKHKRVLTAILHLGQEAQTWDLLGWPCWEPWMWRTTWGQTDRSSCRLPDLWVVGWPGDIAWTSLGASDAMTYSLDHLHTYRVIMEMIIIYLVDSSNPQLI